MLFRSGKSNILEALQILWPISFGDEKLRKIIFKGLTPRLMLDSSMCHLQKHLNKPMTIGIIFETTVNRKLWTVDYEVKIQCDDSKKENGGFISETLKAKVPSKTGPAITYISRQGRELEIAKKPYKIAKDNSSLLAIESIYPDFEGLPTELEIFIRAIYWVGATRVFAMSPTGLRDNIDEEKPIEDIRTSSFGLSFVLDNIKEEDKYYELFREALCDILDLEDVRFKAEDIPTLTKKAKAKKTLKRMRFFLVKRTGSDYCLIEEYSDGTLVVAAILEALFSPNDRGPILCLEELENCLHPAAVEKLLRFLQDNADKWPVLITTHSPYVLNGVNPEDVNVAVIDKTGAAHFEKVKNNKQLRDCLNKGLMNVGDLLVKDFQGFRET